jgi:guanylate kinase
VVFGNYYGTPKKQTEDILASGHDVLYDVNWEGAVQLMKTAREDVASIFILPPSLHVLEGRLRNRASDAAHEIQKRLLESKNEIQKCIYYDYIVINDDIEKSLEQVRAILTAERLRKNRVDVQNLISSLG